MLKKYNRYKVMKVFLDNPTEGLRLREISRMTKIAPLSVMNYLKEFEEEEIIRKTTKRKIPFYKANRDDENFVFYKKISILDELHFSGVVNKLWDKLSPEVIVLYGSHARGEAIENSDVDLFIIGKERKVDLSKFEEKLGKEIHLMFESDFKKISKELKNNLLNGIVLKGYLKVF